MGNQGVLLLVAVGLAWLATRGQAAGGTSGGASSPSGSSSSGAYKPNTGDLSSEPGGSQVGSAARADYSGVAELAKRPAYQDAVGATAAAIWKKEGENTPISLTPDPLILNVQGIGGSSRQVYVPASSIADPGTRAAASQEAAVQNLMSMGMTRAQAVAKRGSG